jgi:mRNA interferase HigB
MHIISRKALRIAAQRHPDAEAGLDHWYRVARKADWRNIGDVRRVFPSADPAAVGSGNTVTIFNIAGNKYRLVTVIHYNRGKVYVMMLLAHAEYSRETWKGRL